MKSALFGYLKLRLVLITLFRVLAYAQEDGARPHVQLDFDFGGEQELHDSRGNNLRLRFPRLQRSPRIGIDSDPDDDQEANIKKAFEHSIENEGDQEQNDNVEPTYMRSARQAGYPSSDGGDDDDQEGDSSRSEEFPNGPPEIIREGLERNRRSLRRVREGSPLAAGHGDSAPTKADSHAVSANSTTPAEEHNHDDPRGLTLSLIILLAVLFGLLIAAWGLLSARNKYRQNYNRRHRINNKQTLMGTLVEAPTK